MTFLMIISILFFGIVLLVLGVFMKVKYLRWIAYIFLVISLSQIAYLSIM